MAGQTGRHRLAVLPGLSSRSATASIPGNDIVTTLATLDEDSSNQQLVPLSASNSKLNFRRLDGWNGAASLKSRDSSGSIGVHIHEMTSRIAMLEEANKAILEEVYRLQSNVRTGEFAKKEIIKEEKKIQRELMDTIRSSNDVVAQLTSRLRRAEEKLHQERENVGNLSLHSKKLEQGLFNSQKEADSQRDTQNSLTAELRHRVDDLLRRSEKSDRTSENIVDEFHQMKNRLEMQAMEFSHLQSEIKQRSKRMEDEMKQTLQQSRFQNDTNSMTEQNNLQLRHLLESRMAETRDAVAELRNRITQAESDARTQVQQIAHKLSDVQTGINDLSHKRLEEMQSMEKSRQEHRHSEESERTKLKNKIQGVVEEISDKLLQKEVSLREEALKKFIDVEKLLQKEETSRIDFERKLREETESRWNMQHKLYLDEMQAMKEMRRSDRAKQSSNYKKIDDCILFLDKKLNHDKKTLEKVLFAEITKREIQSAQIYSQLEGVQEQLQVAISTLQQALGGLQFQMSKDKEQFINELKTRLAEEELKLSRAISDVDARLTAISIRITQQDATLETKMSEFQTVTRNQHNELLHDASEWRDAANKDIISIHEALKEIPQEIRETQERLDLYKVDFNNRAKLESESRLKDADVTKKQLRHLMQRIDDFDSTSIDDKKRHDRFETDLHTFQATVAQIERLTNESRSNLGVRINSETKMRLEDTSAIKREVARLRVDIQPLLWQHNSLGRTFIKTPTSFLNEWGIYQCARWHDIKMRWLRLLRNKQPTSIVGDNHTNSIASMTSNAIVDDSDPRSASEEISEIDSLDVRGQDQESTGVNSPSSGSDAARVSADQQTRPTSGQKDELIPSQGGRRQVDTGSEQLSDVSNLGEVIDDDITTSNEMRENPQPAWYNRDKVGENDDDANDEEEKEEEGGGKPDDKQPNIAGSHEDRTNLNNSPVLTSRMSGHKSGTSRNSGKLSRRASGESKPGEKNSASPGGSSNVSKAPTTSRNRLKRSPAITGGGKSYDMEGSR